MARFHWSKCIKSLPQEQLVDKKPNQAILRGNFDHLKSKSKNIWHKQEQERKERKKEEGRKEEGQEACFELKILIFARVSRF